MSKWETVKLKDLGDIVTGNTPKTSEEENYNSNDIPFIKPSDFDDENILMKSTEFYISEAARSKARILPVGSIIMTCIGNIGKTMITNKECAFNQQINAIILNKNVDSRFIAYSLLYKKDILQKHANAAVIPIINKTEFSNIEIFLPPLKVQCRIAENLNKVLHLVDLCNSILEKLDLLVKARFVEMFGDPVSNPKKWETKPFLDIGKCKNGMNFHYDDNGVEIHCLGVGDFKDLSIITDTSILPKISLNEIPTEEYLLQNDDIVFVRSNGNKALVGRSLAIYPNDVPTTFSGFCIRFRKEDDSVIIPYILRVLKTESIRKKMAGRGANIQNLNQQILSSLEIPVPPIDLQAQFSALVEQIDKSKLVVKKVHEKAETLKKSLMQKYFG